VADEPTGALDTASTEQVFSILRDIADRGQTVAVIHDLARRRADRRIHIVDGKIAEITERGGGWLVRRRVDQRLAERSDSELLSEAHQP
jgi:lipoprotein-releasing system ATP-binding protein